MRAGGSEVLGAVVGVVEVPCRAGEDACVASCAVDGCAYVDELLPSGALCEVLCPVSALLSGAACLVALPRVHWASAGPCWDWGSASRLGAGMGGASSHGHLLASRHAEDEPLGEGVEVGGHAGA